MYLFLRLNCGHFQDKRDPVQSTSSLGSVAGSWTFITGSLGKWKSVMLVLCLVFIPTTMATWFHVSIVPARKRPMTGTGCQSTDQVVLSTWLFNLSSADALWEMLTFDVSCPLLCPHARPPCLQRSDLFFPSRPLVNWPGHLSYIF